MDVVTISDAAAQLALVDRAAAGEDVAISRDGVPLVRLTRLEPGRRSLTFGLLEGRVIVPQDFDEPLPTDALCTAASGPGAE